MGIETETREWEKDTTNWFADAGWEETGDGSYIFQGEEDWHWFSFRDMELLDKRDSLVELEINLGQYQAAFILQQETVGDIVKHRLIVPPFKENYVNSMDNYCGVVYGDDGRMEKIRNVKGLPRRIDMDKTVELFLKQVAEKRFEKPVLVKGRGLEK